MNNVGSQIEPRKDKKAMQKYKTLQHNDSFRDVHIGRMVIAKKNLIKLENLSTNSSSNQNQREK